MLPRVADLVQRYLEVRPSFALGCDLAFQLGHPLAFGLDLLLVLQAARGDGLDLLLGLHLAVVHLLTHLRPLQLGCELLEGFVLVFLRGELRLEILSDPVRLLDLLPDGGPDWIRLRLVGARHAEELVLMLAHLYRSVPFGSTAQNIRLRRGARQSQEKLKDLSLKARNLRPIDVARQMPRVASALHGAYLAFPEEMGAGKVNHQPGPQPQ